MKSEISWLLALASFFALASLAVAQDSQPCPEVPPNTLGCELVAWSHLQEPVPLPEPQSQPGQQTEADSQARVSKITGIIVLQGEKYVLKAGATTTYQLDDQERAKRYQDKRVRVVGRLDSGNHTFHIESI